MRKDPLPSLHDILRSIAWIEEDTKGATAVQFAQNRRTRQLVERNLEIISEASRRIPKALKAQHSDIPWREIAGIGNVMRHDYDEVAPKVLWDVVRKDLKPLKRAIRAMVRTLEQS